MGTLGDLTTYGNLTSFEESDSQTQSGFAPLRGLYRVGASSHAHGFSCCCSNDSTPESRDIENDYLAISGVGSGEISKSSLEFDMMILIAIAM